MWGSLGIGELGGFRGVRGLGLGSLHLTFQNDFEKFQNIQNFKKSDYFENVCRKPTCQNYFDKSWNSLISNFQNHSEKSWR